MTNKQIMQCAKIACHYGLSKQREILVEECAELIQAVCKMKRNYELVSENFIEALADVSIMIEQMVLMLSNDNRSKFLDKIDFKLYRQTERMRSEE